MKEVDQYVIYITSETLCDEGVNKVLMASLINTWCLFLSLAFVLRISHTLNVLKALYSSVEREVNWCV